MLPRSQRPTQPEANQRTRRQKPMWLAASFLGAPTPASCRGALLADGSCGCKRDCSGHGGCVAGLCVCGPSWLGDDCSRLAPKAPTAGLREAISCPHDCWGLGTCNLGTGACVCMPGYAGADCSEGICPRDCSGRGVCVAGTQPRATALRGFATNETAATAFWRGGCRCEAGWTGRDCGLLVCPHGCHGHGTCVNGTCACESGYAGAACDEPYCPWRCRNGGACVGGGRPGASCRCPPNFGGPDCSIALSPAAAASTAASVTHSAASGVQQAAGDVATPRAAPATTPTAAPPPAAGAVCAAGCSGRGFCDSRTGRCTCLLGWGGPTCQASLCPGACRGNGDCVGGACLCRPGHTGDDCGVRLNASRGRSVWPVVA